MCGHVTAGFTHCDVLFLQGQHMVFVIVLKVRKANLWMGSIFLCFYLHNQNMLPIQIKTHFLHLQQYGKNHHVCLTRIGRHSEKAGVNVTAHVQHRIIYFLHNLRMLVITQICYRSNYIRLNTSLTFSRLCRASPATFLCLLSAAEWSQKVWNINTFTSDSCMGTDLCPHSHTIPSTFSHFVPVPTP